MKRYYIKWSKGKEQYAITLEDKTEAQQVRDYIEIQAELKLVELREVG